MTASPTQPASGPPPRGSRPVPATARPTLQRERRLWRAGHRWVAGLDEVGRGAWAGPVSVGIVVLVPGVRAASIPTWLRDSKLLAEQRREQVFDEVAGWCADGAVGHASAAECDRWGMSVALGLAARRAWEDLELRPSAVVVDGPVDLLRLPAPETGVAGEATPAGKGGRRGPSREQVELPETVLPVVDADATCVAVAAASVLAKVVRDRLMREEAEHFPPYCFDRNKGYPSPSHRSALQGYGLSAIHRRTWAFVGDLPLR